MARTRDEDEAKIQEAYEAYRRGEFSSIRQCAAFYGAKRSTLTHRLAGRSSRGDRQKQPNRQTLSNSQEAAIVQ